MISVVIPVYNEEKNILPLYERLEKVLRKQRQDYEIVFIDDGSKDGSVKVIERIHGKNKKVRLISFTRNYGKAAGLQAGFDHVKGDVIITMDGDLQDLPEEIPKFLEAIKKADMVVGWRHKRMDKVGKRIVSFVYNNLKGSLTGLRIHDSNCGFKILRKGITENVDMYGEMHRYLPALAHIKGYKVSEIKIKHAERLYGKTKYGLNRMWRGFFDLLTVKFLSSFAKRPFHLFGGLGLFSLLLGFIAWIWLFVIWFSTGTIGGKIGFAILGMLLIFTGIQLMSLGLIGEMIASLKAKERPYEVKRKL